MAPAALPGVVTVVAAWMLDPASFQPALSSARQAAMSIRPSGNGPRMSRPMHAFRNQLIAAATVTSRRAFAGSGSIFWRSR